MFKSDATEGQIVTDNRFTPHATVATVVEHDGKFLLVEEISQGRRVLNQPAGHLEPNESLIEAAIRETLEETCWEGGAHRLPGRYNSQRRQWGLLSSS